jgi:hypothetical protein
VIFPDAVAINTYHIDFHWPDRMERAGTGVTDMLDPHHLPLRMMIPKGAKNLLVAGRGASAEQTAMSAFRVMAVVAQLGFAAGHAARQCVESGTNLATIDIGRLQAAIVAGGQSLDLSDYGGYLRCDLFAHEPLPLEAAAETLHSPALVALDNARFLAAWRASGPGGESEWIAELREKAWSAPQPLEPRDARREAVQRSRASTHVVLDDGRWARLQRGERGTLRLFLSSAGGAAWSAAGEIQTNAGDVSSPAIVATRVGLAVLYIADGGRVVFWHGAVERITDGPPVASSVRLNAPPEHIHSSPAVNA